jgi:DNA-binding FadR family transcriptional regulator
MQAELWACLVSLEEVLVQRLADTGADVTAVHITIGAEDDLDFHRALGDLLPDEPVTLLHRQVIARLKQDTSTEAEQLFLPATLNHAHDELLQAISAPAPAYAAQLAREHLEELAAAAY